MLLSLQYEFLAEKYKFLNTTHAIIETENKCQTFGIYLISLLS